MIVQYFSLVLFLFIFSFFFFDALKNTNTFPLARG